MPYVHCIPESLAIMCNYSEVLINLTNAQFSSEETEAGTKSEVCVPSDEHWELRIEHWSDLVVYNRPQCGGEGYWAVVDRPLEFGHLAPRSGAGKLARGTRFLRTPGILRHSGVRT